MMKPVKAFAYQDHQAHIAVHMAASQDPKIMQLVGQSPMAQQIGAAMQAHIAEHLGFEYRKQMEQLMGIALPDTEKEDDEGIPREMEVQVSQLAAQAAQQLLQRNQAEVQQKQAQQQMQDPLIQLQQQELQIKAKETEIKEKKLQVDAAAKADQLQIERERIAAQKQIAGMQVGAKVAKDKAELSARQQIDGLRAGIDVAKAKDQLAIQKTASERNIQKPTKKGE